MVKNRAAKMAAHAIKSERGIDYPRALAQVAGRRDLHLVLGTDSAGGLVRWNCLPGARSLSIQGPADSGKTALLRRMSAQASAHADVYACFEGSDALPGLKGCATEAADVWDLLLTVRKSVAAVLTEAREHASSIVPASARNSLAARLVRQYASVEGLPVDRRPRPAIVLVDDFDALCRGWEWDGVDLTGADGPEALIAQLAKDGRAAGVSVVIAGRSLSRGRGTDLGLAEKLLLGPATLAERESFLYSEVADLEIGLGEGIFEPGLDDPVVVHFERQ
ncbi:MAG TPA: hypothetical protein VF885_20735 [Arthrobacter sp.]